MEKLKEYQRKRDFRKTLEPAGAAQAVAAGCLYVMHKHAASHDHFDLRLEQDGVLRSWALPKGPSLKAGEKRLAVEVEDHPLEYGGFEGVIPKNQYGGGTVMLWDAGSWHLNGKNSSDHLDFVLEGRQLHGAWSLVKMKNRGAGKSSDKQWLLIKRSDHPPQKLKPKDVSIASGRTMEEIAEDRDNQWLLQKQTQKSKRPNPKSLSQAKKAPLPAPFSPQLATLTNEVPKGPKWLHELKYDGYRLLAFIDGDDIRLYTRNGHDWSQRFSALVRQLSRFSDTTAIIDGELVKLAQDGSSDFRLLQEAISAKKTDQLHFYCFDLLYLDGFDLRQTSLTERKKLLELTLHAFAFAPTDAVRYCEHLKGQGSEFHEQVCQLSLEGIICKKADEPYTSGRSKQWLKVKCSTHEEFVVGGYTPPEGQRNGFGSLLLGAFHKGSLQYSGRVGSGFSSADLKSLKKKLDGLHRKTSPFADAIPDAKRVSWVTPELVIEVEFTERTRDGRLRHPVFRGVREDRDADDITFGAEKQIEEAPISKSIAGQNKIILAGQAISHPDRIVFPNNGISKQALAEYYMEVADWLLPLLVDRPLAVLRCQESISDACFLQKHLDKAIGRTIPSINIAGPTGQPKQYAYVQSVEHLIKLVQLGVVEFHPWGCTVDDVESPDQMIFDLDPSPGVPWKAVIETARNLKHVLKSMGLTAFLRTTGGKGLHLVMPLVPDQSWDEIKSFSKSVAELMAASNPQRLTAVMSKAKRKNRIFIDYLRNGRGNTAVASYSVRAREGAPVAVPIRWNELNEAMRPDRYNLMNLKRRLSALKKDPWHGFEKARCLVNASLLNELNIGKEINND